MHAALLLTLVSAVLTARPASMPTVPEDRLLLYRPSQRRLGGSDRGEASTSEITEVDRDLYPPSPLDRVPPSPRPRMQRLQRVPVTGLVRGQKGKLIRYRLRGSNVINIWTDHFGPATALPADASRTEGRTWSSWWKMGRTRPGDPPATNEQMSRLLQQHPDLDAAFERTARPDSSAIGKKYHAVWLQGGRLDSGTLDQMLKAKQPFYVQGSKGKVWFFDTKDGNSFTYTDKMDRSDKRLVRKILQALQTEQLTTSAVTPSRAPPRGLTGSGSVASPRMAGQLVDPQSHLGTAWYQRVFKGAKAIFKRPTTLMRSMHRI